MEYRSPPFNRTVAYLRKSRADGDSATVEEVLAKHEKMLQDYCLRVYNAPLPEDHIYREVISGETIAARPMMQKLIKGIQTKEIQGVLCVDLQRLSRGDLSDVGELSKLFQYSGCLIITPVRTYNVADEYDRKFFEMEIMHGNDYLEYIKKIMGRGRRQSVMDGNYISSSDPFGYKRIIVDKRPTLEVVEDEADIVRMIFDWYTGESQAGPSEISRRLNALGTKPRKSEKWSPNSVKNVLMNPLYIGKVCWGRRAEIKDYKDGKIVVTRPWAKDGEYIYADGRHKAIISEEQYNLAQQIRVSRGHPAQNTNKEIKNPFAGLLVCSKCGHNMCMNFAKTRNKEPFVLCLSMDCQTRSIPFSRLAAHIRESMSGTLEYYQSQLGENKQNSPSLSVKKAYERERDELLKQQNRQYELLERGIYSEEVFLTRSAETKKRLENIEAELSELSRNEKQDADYTAFCTTLKQCIEALEDPLSSPATLNALLKTVVTKITYTREKSPRRRWDDTPVSLQIFYKI